MPQLAVILAAGLGSRLSPEAWPKPLVKLLGLSLVERVICTFAFDLGVSKILVVVGHEAAAVEVHVRDIAQRRRLEILCIPADDWQLGNGASALAVRGLTEGRPFYLAMADHLFDPKLVRKLGARSISDGQIHLAIDRNKAAIFDLEDVTRVKLDGDRIVIIGKELSDWDAADTGLFLCTGGLFDGLAAAVARQRYGLSDGIRELAAENRAFAVDVSGHCWLDVDTPAALQEAERRVSRVEMGKTSDGPISRYLNRPVSSWLTRNLLLGINVTPNQISLLSWALCSVAALLFAVGGYGALAIGGGFAQLASIIDGCDGEVARFKRMGSEFGGWFDAVLDRYADAFLLFGLLWHVYWPEASPLTLTVGFAAIVGSFMNSYTADKYDGLMADRLEQGFRMRLGRDVRVFMIFLGALSNLPLVALWVIAVLMNAEVVRRVLVCSRS